MTKAIKIERPKTLKEVAAWSQSLEDFGRNLRDWQHEIQRGGVHSCVELAKRLHPEPELLRGIFEGGDTADAYLAAYAEWIADRAGVARPAWTHDKARVLSDPWFATPDHRRLLVTTPASFRQRNLFTSPEPVFHAQAGRPKVSAEQKRANANRRQKAYRDRVRAKLEKARSAGTV